MIKELKVSLEDAAQDRLKRRPSWSTKFEAPTMPNDMNMKASLDEAAHDRLKRRPSWSTKFEAPAMPSDMNMKTSLDEAANDRLKRRPSWNTKFEGPTDTNMKPSPEEAAPSRLQRLAKQVSLEQLEQISANSRLNKRASLVDLGSSSTLAPSAEEMILSGSSGMNCPELPLGPPGI